MKRSCSVPDCPKPSRARGKCWTHYSKERYDTDPNFREVIKARNRTQRAKIKAGAVAEPTFPAAPLREMLLLVDRQHLVPRLQQRYGGTIDGWESAIYRVCELNSYVSLNTADRLCIELGTHPVFLWPNEWMEVA